MESFKDVFKLSWLIAFDWTKKTPLLLKARNRNELPDNCCLALCRMPGKKNPDNLRQEIQEMKKHGISMIVCLLSEAGTRKVGVDINDYSSICREENILFLNYPVQSMKAPEDSPSQLDSKVVDPVIKHIAEEQGRVAVHCSFGIGRAGTIAGCVLAKLGLFKDTDKCIQYLRDRRQKLCVQSEPQRRYLESYIKNIT